MEARHLAGWDLWGIASAPLTPLSAGLTVYHLQTTAAVTATVVCRHSHSNIQTQPQR